MERGQAQAARVTCKFTHQCSYSWLYISQALYYHCSIDLEYRLFLKKKETGLGGSHCCCQLHNKKNDNIEILNVFNLFNFNLLLLLNVAV